MIRKWYIELIAAEGHSRLYFGTWGSGSGNQVWDSVEFPVDWVAMTEDAILSELYDAVLVLMERRTAR